MKRLLLSSAALLSLALAAQAQFTPGTGGGTVVPPPAPSVPSVPVVPGPTRPQGPSAPPVTVVPAQPTYSWQVPAQPQPPLVQPQPTQPPIYQPQQPVYQPSPSSVLPPQDPVRIVAPQPAPTIYVPALSDAQMSDLTAAIALYPDALLAEMFPAATYLEQLTFADRWLEQHPGADEASLRALALDDNVRDMMHYPTVLNLMTDHLDWTQSLALAFAYQRADLFDSIQRWRSVAVTNGYLYSTAQQDVLQQGSVILIQPPPRTQVVYVPVYDPAIVFVRTRPVQPRRDVITFSSNGFSLSFAFNDLDWRDHEVRVPRHEDHDSGPGPGGRGPGNSGGPGNGGGRGDGRGGDSRVVFVPSAPKPGVAYPLKVVTPQPDKKVITLPAPTSTPPAGRGRGPGGAGAPGRGNP